MTSVDLRQSLNAVSDVIHNRPPPLREFDQIYMKAADMLLQAEHVGRRMAGRDVVFLGDGDAIGLSILHLHHQGILAEAPARIHVLDFDERVVLSIRRFSKHFGIDGRISAELYNVAEPMPDHHLRAFDGFYSNPPFGASNGGRSIEAFLIRCLEATDLSAEGCLVIADDDRHPWTQEVMYRTQKWLLKQGVMIGEVLPRFHTYHLDDAPNLTSCSLYLRRIAAQSTAFGSDPLPIEFVDNFYGSDSPLNVRYVKDRTGGGRFPSRDHELIPFEVDDNEAAS